MHGGVIPHHQQKVWNDGYYAGCKDEGDRMEVRVKAAYQRGITDTIIYGGMTLALIVLVWMAATWLFS